MRKTSIGIWLRIIQRLPKQLLCKLGYHKFVLLESIGAFGAAGSVQKVRCERCGTTMTRQQK